MNSFLSKISLNFFLSIEKKKLMIINITFNSKTRLPIMYDMGNKQKREATNNLNKLISFIFSIDEYII